MPTNVGSNDGLGIDPERAAFEADAAAYEFDLTRDNGASSITAEPWSEYLDHATGHRWAGWLAARSAIPAVTAQPLVWELHGKNDFADKYCGFYISHAPDDDAEEPYHAAWGEGDSESFATLDEAEAWCQREIDMWVRRFALVTPNVGVEPHSAAGKDLK